MASSSTARDILYDAENYLDYKAQLETVISQNAAASIVYGGVIQDPVTTFEQYNPKAKDLLCIGYRQNNSSGTKTRRRQLRNNRKTSAIQATDKSTSKRRPN